MKGEKKLTNDVHYCPKAGDIIWTDFDPRIGREQSGRRPALVLSPIEFFQVSAFAIVCPITSRIKNFGSSVLLPVDFAIQGEILTSHVRSIDTMARPIKYTDITVSSEILHEVRAKLAVLCGMNFF